MRDEGNGERLEKVAGAIASEIAGADLVGVAMPFLRDSKFPDPVVPPDLHLVKPAKLDADGNVSCVRCGRGVRWEAAMMVGSEGYACGTCQQSAIEVVDASNVRIKRRLWPWVTGGAVVIGGLVVGLVLRQRANDRAELERDYPVLATAEQRQVIETAAATWRKSEAKLVAAAEAPPSLASLQLGEACAIDEKDVIELRPNDRDPANEIKVYATVLAESAERGRFPNEVERAFMLELASSTAVMVVKIEHTRPAKLEVSHETREIEGFTAGERTGAAYLYGTDGTLRCACQFTAESSDEVHYETISESYRDPARVREALDADLDRQATIAIGAALRKVL